MVYGVDECRVCGKPIRVNGPEAMQFYLEDLRKGPVWPEAKWRKAGFKACPTREQVRQPARGCCSQCATVEAMKRAAPVRKAASIVAVAAVFFALVYLVVGSFN